MTNGEKPTVYNDPNIGDYWLENEENFPHISGNLFIRPENFHNYNLYCLQTGYSPIGVFSDATQGTTEKLSELIEGCNNDPDKRNFENLYGVIVGFLKERDEFVNYITDEYFHWQENQREDGNSLWRNTPPKPKI